MESEMAKENSSTKTAATMMEIGKTIKCMDGENYSIKVENSLMKEIGLMMNSMAMVKFTMTTLCLQTAASTILTLICLMTIGSTMKECWPMTQKKGGEKLN